MTVSATITSHLVSLVENSTTEYDWEQFSIGVFFLTSGIEHWYFLSNFNIGIFSIILTLVFSL